MLFRPGGGWEGGGAGESAIRSSGTFTTKQVQATKLGEFPKIYLETIWCSKSLPIKFDFGIAAPYDRRFSLRILNFPPLVTFLKAAELFFFYIF